MGELNETRVGGTEQKSDIVLILRKKTSGGVSIQLKSSVQDLFGDQIKGSIERALETLGIKNAVLKIPLGMGDNLNLTFGEIALKILPRGLK